VILIPRGAKIQVIQSNSQIETLQGKTGTWVEASYGEHKGWVFDAFLGVELPQVLLGTYASTTTQGEAVKIDAGNIWAESDNGMGNCPILTIEKLAANRFSITCTETIQARGYEPESTVVTWLLIDHGNGSISLDNRPYKRK
jgi:hypothetical protein